MAPSARPGIVIGLDVMWLMWLMWL
ncbi:hypothetical protein HMPREF9451_01859, partial [Slackia piriformis YIT 12062]